VPSGPGRNATPAKECPPRNASRLLGAGKARCLKARPGQSSQRGRCSTARPFVLPHMAGRWCPRTPGTNPLRTVAARQGHDRWPAVNHTGAPGTTRLAHVGVGGLPPFPAWACRPVPGAPSVKEPRPVGGGPVDRWTHTSGRTIGTAGPRPTSPFTSGRMVWRSCASLGGPPVVNMGARVA
jgi:hypothetical protein